MSTSEPDNPSAGGSGSPDSPTGSEASPGTGTPDKPADLVAVTEDRLRAVVPLWGLPEKPTWETIVETATRLMIAVELDRGAYEAALAGGLLEAVIAQGIPPKAGVKPSFDVTPEILKKLKNGFVCVEPEDVIGIEVPAVPGKSGLDVFNNLVPPPEPSSRDGALRFTDNTSINQTENKVVSKIKGVIRMEGGEFKVSETLELPGDLDIAVGNVKLNCSLNVKGTIRSGITVRAEGSLTVGEHIDDAIVIIDGDIDVGKGIFHRESGRVEALGSIRCHHAENATLIAGKDIEIAAEAMHCRLTALGAVLVTEAKGVVIGGVVAAGARVEARVIGSDAQTQTRVQVGFSHTHVPGLLAEIEAGEKLLTELAELLDPNGKPCKVFQLSGRGRELQGHLEQFRGRLAAGTLRRRISVGRWLKDYSPVGTLPHVLVLGNVYRKVEIHIDKMKYAVDKLLMGVRFQPDPEGKEILLEKAGQ